MERLGEFSWEEWRLRYNLSLYLQSQPDYPFGQFRVLLGLFCTRAADCFLEVVVFGDYNRAKFDVEQGSL